MTDTTNDLAPTPKPLTKGEYRVGITFNPGGDPSVNEIKRKAAEFIDFIEDVATNSKNTEVKRLCALAQTDIETAAMHAVKAVTKPELPAHLTK